MKRVLFALLFHCLIVFICLFCYVHYKWSIPELIPGMAFSYKLLTSAQLLLMWLPAVLGSAYIVAYSKIFGQDDKHIMVKYSPYILTQFKFVAIFAIVATTLVICGQEVGSPLIKQRLRHMEEAPALYKEYMQAAHQYYESGDLVFAVQYAEAAERLHPLSQEAVTLKSDLEVQLEGPDYDVTLSTARRAYGDPNFSPHERNATSYELFQKAKAAYAKENWIDAHYYAIMAQRVAEPGSANENDAKMMAADAWNMLDEPTQFENNDLTEQYQLKKLAYSQLMAGNMVEAYYSFSELLQRYPRDEDIRRYYAAAAVEMEAQYFFLDEIPISFGMEDRRDIAFRMKLQDGGQQVVFIKGLSSVQNTGSLVQYARGLDIYQFDKDGVFQQSMYVPYAKILSQTIASLDKSTQKELEYTGLDMEKGTVPTIMLESVDRVQPNSLNKPVYTFAEGQGIPQKKILTLPIAYSDFLLLKNTSHDPEEMTLVDVIQLAFKASDYGYSPIIYGQDACSRMSKPFLYIVFFIALASIGWNYRIMSGKFRLIWTFGPIFLTIGLFLLLEIGKYTQRLLNYGLFGFFRFGAVPIIFVLSLIGVIWASLSFVSRRSQ